MSLNKILIHLSQEKEYKIEKWEIYLIIFSVIFMLCLVFIWVPFHLNEMVGVKVNHMSIIQELELDKQSSIIKSEELSNNTKELAKKVETMQAPYYAGMIFVAVAWFVIIVIKN